MRAGALVVLVALVVPARAEEGIVTKAEIIAARPPDDGRKAPLELESLVPIEHTDLVISTHRSEEHAGEVAVWERVAGGYRRLAKLTEEPGMGSYAPVRHFQYDGRVFLVVSFVPLVSRYAPEETVFAVDHYAGAAPSLTKIDIQSPIDWFHARLGPDESVQEQRGFFLGLDDDRLEWSFAVWRRDDPSCCPSAGQVRGTFDLCEERHHDDATDRWSSTWRMVVRDATREPTRPAPTRPPARQILPVCPALAHGVSLPHAAGGLGP